MKYSGRIKWPVSRRLYAGRARNRGIDADHFFSLLAPFFAIPGAFPFWKEVKTNSFNALTQRYAFA